MRGVQGTLYNCVGVVKRHFCFWLATAFYAVAVFLFSYQESFVLPDQGSHRESYGGTLVPPAIYSIFNHRP
jgi:hypothetical protein